jgi:aspartate aminotransferase
MRNYEHLLSKRLQAMEESATILMAQKARNLKASGVNVINLSLGEPDFDTPDFIKEAAKEALDLGYTKYTPVPGLLELREAIHDKFKRDNKLNYTVNEIVVSNGAKQSIANVCMALLDEGDEIVIFSPYWVSYLEIAKMTGAKPVIIHAGIEKDFKVSAKQLSQVLTANTKLIIFSSPCNPTGSVFTLEELQAIANVVAQYPDLYIISDEIYEYISFGSEHHSIGSIDEVKDRTITVNGFSKGFSMTGWRLGYMGAPGWIADACAKIQGQFTSGAASFSQKAAVEALRSTLDETFKMRDAFLVRRDLMLAELSKIEGFQLNRPEGAFYLFPDVSSYFGKRYEDHHVVDADTFAIYILEKSHVALVSGAAFGAPDCVRISYAASETDLREACNRIAAACALLK